MTIHIDGQHITLTSRDHLIAIIEILLKDIHHEVWIKGDGETALCVMTNQENAFLLFIRHEGDSGYRSINASGDENKFQQFKLSNGQADEYPETWLTRKENIKSTLLTYFDSGTMDKNVDWILAS